MEAANPLALIIGTDYKVTGETTAQKMLADPGIEIRLVFQFLVTGL
jgi:hypothetical protein